MTAGCARCGSCCDPVWLPDEVWESVQKWSAAALAGVPDPSTDEGWAHWTGHGWTGENRDAAIFRYRPDGRYRADADFITGHWHPLGDGEYQCDRFDPVARLCTAHGERPPVCRDFPWYGEDPQPHRAESLNPQCSYLADIAPGLRPEGSRPLIPLTPA